MQKIVPTGVVLKCLGIALLAFMTASCATAPSGGSEQAAPAQTRPSDTDLAAVERAFGAYQRRDFAAAAAGYEAAAGSSDAAVAQVAHLGKALVHLSTDAEWRDVDAAALQLQSAEGYGEAAGVEAGLLINALSSLIGVEADITAAQRRASDADAKVRAAQEERAGLQAEIANLNATLEKLKNLTIGN